MSSIVKRIVQRLSEEPYKKRFNIVTFDSLETIQLLQVLNDVFSEVDHKLKIDVRGEDVQQTALKFLECLKLYRYNVPSETNDIIGDKATIYPILEWLLEKTPDLKKRAYLARYLCKIKIPSEYLQDDVNVLNEEYEQIIEKFKEVHKNYESLSLKGGNILEIKRDITAMQEEKEQLSRHVKKLKDKLEKYPTNKIMTDLAKKLRLERQHNMKLTRQVDEQKSLLITINEKIQSIKNQLMDNRSKNLEQDPQSVLHRMEQETRVNQYMVNDTLPTEIKNLRRYLDDISKVATQASITQNHLEDLKSQIRNCNDQNTRLIERRLKSIEDSDEGKLNLFRQQSNIVANKKASVAATLFFLRDKVSSQEKELDNKSKRQSDAIHIDDTTADENEPKILQIHQYANKVRAKNTQYKLLKDILSELKIERGILSRTLDKLKKEELESLEVIKFNGEEVTMNKISPRDGSDSDRKLEKKFRQKKEEITPLIKEMRQLRQKNQDLRLIHQDRKTAYDALLTNLDSQLAVLEQSTKVIEDKVFDEENKNKILELKLCVLEMDHKIINGYSDSSGEQRNVQTTLAQLNKKLLDCENKNRQLKEQQRTLLNTQKANEKQLGLWRNMVKIFKAKIEIHEKEMSRLEAGEYADVKQIQQDRLIL